MKIFLPFTLFSLLFFTCNKNDDQESIDLIAYSNCHNSLNLDSVGIHNKLVGIWKWKKMSCYPDNGIQDADRNITVRFDSNGQYTLTEDSTVYQGTWNLVIVDGTSYGLNQSQASGYLFGRILFCANELLFNDSYLDGCDKLFVREN